MSPHLWSWITLMNDGRWVQVGAIINDMHVPLTFADRDTASCATVREIAVLHHVTTGQPVRLVRYSDPVVIEAMEPKEATNEP